MGGAVALELALKQPEWLLGLVLTCSGARLPISEDLLALLKEDFEAAVDLIMARSFGPHEGTLTYRQKAIRYGTHRQMLRTQQEVVLRDYEACRGFDVRDRLGEIRVPVLVIASKEDKVAPPELSMELHEGIRGSRLVVVEGAGHMLPMERADEYNRVVAQFLESQASL
jgi:pimeloyl-ACP methyl ester carboxylesterase